jgi:inorganic pyrophosphatase
MNIPDYIKLVKKILNEDAGSEGLVYIVEAKSGLNAVENELLKIEEVKAENGIKSGKVTFAYPHDYGFALSTIQETLNGIDVVALKLVY